MLSKFKSAFFTDLKAISLNKRILIPLCILILVIILIPFCIHVVTHHEYLYHGVQPAKFYTLISITLVALIPVLTSIAYGNLLSDKTYAVAIKGSTEVSGNVPDSTYIRIFTLLLISFILINLSILIIKPVPAQGWLRTLYAAILLSFQAAAGFLYTGIKDHKRIAGIALSVLYWLFIIALPVGLLLHHPWNRVACFSPYYWIAWAWMLKSPTGSMIYGSVAVILTSIVITILLRLFLRRSA